MTELGLEPFIYYRKFMFTSISFNIANIFCEISIYDQFSGSISQKILKPINLFTFFWMIYRYGINPSLKISNNISEYCRLWIKYLSIFSSSSSLPLKVLFEFRRCGIKTIDFKKCWYEYSFTPYSTKHV